MIILPNTYINQHVYRAIHLLSVIKINAQKCNNEQNHYSTLWLLLFGTELKLWRKILHHIVKTTSVCVCEFVLIECSQLQILCNPDWNKAATEKSVHEQFLGQ